MRSTVFSNFVQYKLIWSTFDFLR